MSENHRGPEVPEGKVRVVECRDGLARITLEELGRSLWIPKLGKSLASSIISGVNTRSASDTKMQSVLRGPHYGVRIVLNIDVSRQLKGKISKRRRNHSTHALHEGQETDQTEEANLTRWDEARRNCVFEGTKFRCQDGQEVAKAARSQYASASWFPGRGRRVGPRFEGLE